MSLGQAGVRWVQLLQAGREVDGISETNVRGWERTEKMLSEGSETAKQERWG